MSDGNTPVKFNKEKALKVGRIALNVLVYLFMALCVVALVFALASKLRGDDAVNVFGKQMRIVITESMSKSEDFDYTDCDIKDIPLSSMVFIDTVPTDREEREAWFDGLEIGDVLTFKYVYQSQVTITHRITDIEPDGKGGHRITLKGDNKAKDSDPSGQIINTSEHGTSPNYVIGKVTGQSKLLGKLISGLKTPVGIGLIVILPCAIIAILEIVKIVNYFSEGKRKKQEEESKAKDGEIEELRRRLEEMERKNAAVSEKAPDPEAKAENGTSGGEEPRG